MSRTVSPSSGKPYGLARVCRVWRASRATIYRHLSSSRPKPPRRPGPVGSMPDPALLEAIRAVLGASPFHGEGHRKVWARLRVAGVRTSKRRVLRLMRENNLLAPSRVGAPRGPRNHDGTIIPEAVDTMWGTDLTTTITGEGQVAVFVAVDHYSAECVGIHAARRATRFEALEPIRQGVRRCFGAFAKEIARGLAVRHDHGSQYMSDGAEPSQELYIRIAEIEIDAARVDEYKAAVKEEIEGSIRLEWGSSRSTPCTISTIPPASASLSIRGRSSLSGAYPDAAFREVQGRRAGHSQVT